MGILSAATGLLGGAAGGAVNGAVGVGNFAVDTALKIANFIGIKNIASAGITLAGAVGHNKSLMFAGIGSFVGGKSILGTLAGTGGGFALGSMLDATSTLETPDILPDVTADIPDIPPLDTPTFDNSALIKSGEEAGYISELTDDVAKTGYEFDFE